MAEHEDDAELWEWAREQARLGPRWSDAHWRKVNAILGYRVRETSEKVRRAEDGPGDSVSGWAARTVLSWHGAGRRRAFGLRCVVWFFCCCSHR